MHSALIKAQRSPIMHYELCITQSAAQLCIMNYALIRWHFSLNDAHCVVAEFDKHLAILEQATSLHLTV